MSIQAFCDLQRSLLALEHEAELAESTALLQSASAVELETKGVAITGLVISGITTGLFGKTLVSFNHHLANSRKHSESARIGTNSISSGDIVGIFTPGSFAVAPALTGVVHSIDQKAIQIVLDADDEVSKLWDSARFNIAKVGSNVTHTRLLHTVKDLESSSHFLLSSLFESQPDDLENAEHIPDELETQAATRLNDPQRDAVRNALANRLVTVIQGPPGTGKTTTLAAYIAEAIHRDPKIKILACAPSNVAVDNLALRTLASGVRNIVRVGHPTRVNDEMLSHCLDALVAGSDFATSCSDIRKEIQAILDSRRGFSDLKALRRELKEREQKSVEEVFKQANVVFTTCNGAFNIARKFNLQLDVCVVDECAQALEMSCWIPVLQAKRTVLGGDHQQLSATIHSKEAETAGLGTSLFERCFKRFSASPTVVNLLSVQYRMNETIMGWSNKEFYDGKLVAHESVARQTLHVPAGVMLEVGGVDMRSVIESPFVFCDTAGVDGAGEDAEHEKASKSNPGEVAIVSQYLDLLDSPGIADDICVISPYLRQTELIRQAADGKHDDVDISTVDSFQGREGDVVVISLVRSNPAKVVGFLSDYRRLNVAVTRAKRHVFIVGDSDTISSDSVLKSLYDYACDHGLVISAQTFLEGVELPAVAASAQKAPKPSAPRQERKPGQPIPTKVHPVVPVAAPSDTEANRKELTDKIETIPTGETFFFPPTLTSAERKLVHSICDDRGIAHGSTGEGVERKVWVRKKEVREVATRSMNKPDPAPHQPPIRTPSVRPTVAPKAVKKDLIKTTALAPVPAKPEGICPHPPCAMSTKLVSLPCGLCKKDFCIAHATPEAHGCGDAAKKAARAALKKELKQPQFPLGKGGVSTEQLRNKMSSKIASMESKRNNSKK